MGYNATVVVMVDALNQLERDTDFGASLSRAIREHLSGSARPGRTDVRAGSHYNAAHVVEVHHADSTAVITVGGNLGIQQHQSHGWHHHETEGREKLLREWAAKMGYELVRKEAEPAGIPEVPVETPSAGIQSVAPAYLLVLSGGGDTTVKLVTDAVWNWIQSDYQSEDSSYDERVPADVIADAATNGNRDNFEKGTMRVTRSSCENDRALAAPGREFDGFADALAYLKSKNIEVKEEFHGCIY